MMETLLQDNCLQPGPDWPWLTLVARTTVDPRKLAGTIATVAQSVGRDVPSPEVAP